DAWRQLPDELRRPVETQLSADEKVLAFFVVDLDERLFFARGLVALTPARVFLARTGKAVREVTETALSWPLDSISKIGARARGGLGPLDILGPTGRLAEVHYTLGQAGAVRDLVDSFENLRQGKPPVTGGPGDDLSEVPEAEEQPVAISVGALFRLSRFARNRKRELIWGTLLTLATTAAGPVAPCITITPSAA